MKGEAILIIIIIVLLSTLTNFNVICHSWINDIAIGLIGILGFVYAYDVWHRQKQA